jgi:hypothetical protein
MRRIAEHVSRRRFLALAGLVVAGGLASAACGDDEDGGELPTVSPATPEGTPTKEVHGVCFMPGPDGKPCKSFYQDLGRVEREGPDVIALYTFPADVPNPLDAGGNYLPERLQNNVFAADGRFWKMLAVESGSVTLIATTDGTREITSTTMGSGEESRDLTRQPYLSEEEIMRDMEEGRIMVEDKGVVVDCPVTEPPAGAIVVDLNPDVGKFCPPA